MKDISARLLRDAIKLLGKEEVEDEQPQINWDLLPTDPQAWLAQFPPQPTPPNPLDRLAQLEESIALSQSGFVELPLPQPNEGEQNCE